MANDIDLLAYECGALYGVRNALAGFLDDRSRDARLAVSLREAESPEAIEAAEHIREACRALRALADRLREKGFTP